MAFRCDRAPITKYQKLPNGRLKVWGTFSRVGPLTYVNPKTGQRYDEWLTADELFREDSLETAGLAPVTFRHPPEGKVTPELWKDYNVGCSGSKVLARQDAGLVDVVYVIGEAEAIAAVESGEAQEISVGYDTDPVSRSDGRIYQTNRVYDHHAIVPCGRAGPAASFHMDSDDWAVQCDTEPTKFSTDSNPGDSMEKTDMQTYKGMQMDAQAMKAYQDMETQLKSMKADMDKLKTDMAGMEKRADESLSELNTRLTAERDVLQGRVDELTEAAKTHLDAADVEKQAGEIALMKLDAFVASQPFLKTDTRFDASVTPLEWKRQAISTARPNLNLDGKNDAYISAAFDMLSELGVTKQDEQRADAFQQTLSVAQVGGDRTGSSLKADAADDEAQIRADHAAATAAYTWSDN